MKTYCNVRLALTHPAHLLTQEERSTRVNKWLASHDDESVVEHAVRGRMGVNSGGSLSVAITISPVQAARLSRLLNGRTHTLSSLIRNIFEDKK
jgi:hypothetical protein